MTGRKLPLRVKVWVCLALPVGTWLAVRSLITRGPWWTWTGHLITGLMLVSVSVAIIPLWVATGRGFGFRLRKRKRKLPPL